MTSAGFMGDMPAGVRGRDTVFTEAINQKMRVPDRLRVGPEQRGEVEEDRGRQRTDEPPPAYSMHIPDRLALTDAPDMSPRPLFTSSKPGSSAQAGPAWESQYLAWERESLHRDPGQSPLRRSYSDTAFGRTPPGTPTHTKQVPHTPSSTMQESWLGQEDESGAVVEFIVLRRQVVKMSRRLAGLERQNAERRQTELVLFSLLMSACLLNGWLWIRR